MTFYWVLPCQWFLHTAMDDLQLSDACAGFQDLMMHDMTPIRRQASSVEPTTLYLGCVGYVMLTSMATMSIHSGCSQWPPIVFRCYGVCKGYE